jgi:enoyl-CoA hydratase
MPELKNYESPDAHPGDSNAVHASGAGEHGVAERGAGRSTASLNVDRLADGVHLVTMRRPPVNAFDAEMYAAAAEALDHLQTCADARALVIIGEGTRAFSAGTDLAAFASDEATFERTQAAAQQFFETLARCRIPLVGALNGPAVGGGAMIAAECDVLVAVTGAHMKIPELQLGVPGAASHIKRLVPYPKALRMMLLGELLTASEALDCGLLWRIADERSQLLPLALAAARSIAALDPAAVREAREIVRAPERDAALGGYRSELAAMSRLACSRRTQQ